jgi:hypothetical protein
VVNGDRLAGEVEADLGPRSPSLAGLEQPHLLLCHTDNDHPLPRREVAAVARDHVVHALAGLEGNQRGPRALREGVNPRDEPLV